jgi:hypothetical protein
LGLSSYNNTSVAPVEKLGDTPIIPYFKEDGNGFPNTLVDMYERGGIHRAAIQIKHRLSCGDGLIIVRRDGEQYEENPILEKWLSKVNNNQSAFEVISNQLLDVVLFNMTACQIAGKGLSTTVHHQDTSTLRFAKPVEVKGEPSVLDSVYISNYWGDKELKKPDERSLTEYAEKLPLFEGQADPSILVVKNYQPTRNYYPIPDYFSLSFKRWVDIEYKIPTYNDSRIDNKFMPSGIYSVYGDPPADMTAKQYAQQIQDSFTGEGNNSRLIVQLLSNKESAPDYTEMSNEPDGIFLNLDTLAQQSILRGHKMHPMFLMATAGSLGQSSEIKTLFELYYSSVIKGYQEMIIEFWNKVLDHAGFGEYSLSIANNNPVSILGTLDISKYLSVNEVRTQLGYEANESENSNEKSLYELLGAAAPQVIATISSKELLISEKRSILQVLFGLDIEQVDKLVPLTPTI